MNAGYLIFHPTADQPLPEVSQVLTRLSETGLTGQPLPGMPQHFLTGPHFLQRITFLGCSPSVPLTANTNSDNALCSIRLLGPYPAPRLITGQNSRPPRCHGCRHRFHEWQEQIAEPDREIRCPECGQESSWRDLNWRQMAGSARLFIAISQVFPGEAVPTAGLMQTLQQGGEEWDYFYVQQPLLWPGGQNPGEL